MPRKQRTMHELMYRAPGRGNPPWLYLYASLAWAHLHPIPKQITYCGIQFNLVEKRKVQR